MNENTTNPTFTLPQPLVAPLGVRVTPAMVQDVWDTFVKPGQSDDAPPQSAQMRALMGILRAVNAALEAGPDTGTAPAIIPGARTVPPGKREWSSGPTDHTLTEARTTACTCEDGWEDRVPVVGEEAEWTHAGRVVRGVVASVGRLTARDDTGYVLGILEDGVWRARPARERGHTNGGAA